MKYSMPARPTRAFLIAADALRAIWSERFRVIHYEIMDYAASDYSVARLTIEVVYRLNGNRTITVLIATVVLNPIILDIYTAAEIPITLETVDRNDHRLISVAANRSKLEIDINPLATAGKITAKPSLRDTIEKYLFGPLQTN